MTLHEAVAFLVGLSAGMSITAAVASLGHRREGELCNLMHFEAADPETSIVYIQFDELGASVSDDFGRSWHRGVPPKEAHR